MFRKRNVSLLLTVFIVLFSFNINVKAAVEGSCEYCKQGNACLQVNQAKDGTVTYKYKASQADTKWKDIKGNKITVSGTDYPVDIDSSMFKNMTSCPGNVAVGLEGLGKNKKLHVYPVTSCYNNKFCVSSATKSTFPKKTNGNNNSNGGGGNGTGTTKSGSTTSGLLKPKKENKNTSCKEILGSDLVAKIQEIVDIVWILVPVLLIVFGIMDFGKAIFSNDENEMKKAQATFFKRVIIAVAFFLVPALLQLVLKISHGIWGGIPSDLCGIEFGFK